MKTEADQENLRRGLEIILDDPLAQKYLLHILELCGTYKNPYRKDSAETAFNCGMQNIGQIILQEISLISDKALKEFVHARSE